MCRLVLPYQARCARATKGYHNKTNLRLTLEPFASGNWVGPAKECQGVSTLQTKHTTKHMTESSSQAACGYLDYGQEVVIAPSISVLASQIRREPDIVGLPLGSRGFLRLFGRISRTPAS